MTDVDLIAQWRDLWDEMEEGGGETSEATGFINVALERVERDLRVRGLRPEYGRCSYAPDFCPYGCPDAQGPEYWK